MSGGHPSIYGFSSYARVMRATVKPRHEHLENCLRDVLAPNPFSLYLDVASSGGQLTGLWPTGLVDELARASVFIWWQSPSWFASATCRWELNCFLARADRIAAAIGAPNELVRTWLVEPVRITPVPDESWGLLGSDASVFHDLYKNLNIQLKLNAETTSIGEDDCREGAGHFRHELARELAPYGGLQRMARVPPEDAAVRAAWLEMGRRSGAWVRHEGPGAPHPLSATEQRRLAMTRKFGRDMAIVEGAPPFAMCARVERGEAHDVTPRGRDLAGRALWDVEGADAVEDHARSEGLRLPTPDEGARMLALLNGSPAEREAAGVRERAGDFWCRARGDEPSTLTARRPCAPIFLVADEPL